MEKKWSEMSPAKKKLFVLVCIYTAIWLAFVVLDLSGMWKSEIPRYMLVAFCLVEGVVEWKKSWKMALLSFVVAILALLNVY